MRPLSTKQKVQNNRKRDSTTTSHRGENGSIEQGRLLSYIIWEGSKLNSWKSTSTSQSSEKEWSKISQNKKNLFHFVILWLECYTPNSKCEKKFFSKCIVNSNCQKKNTLTRKYLRKENIFFEIIIKW